MTESPRFLPRRNWRRMADRLAERLMHQCYCSRHDDPDEDPDCPFCDDIRAYREYIVMGGTVRRDSFNNVHYISIADLANGGNRPLLTGDDNGL
jgi:hypothetical protein